MVMAVQASPLVLSLAQRLILMLFIAAKDSV
jgi:hypothetical protein